jgi:WD40 repeat protein
MSTTPARLLELAPADRLLLEAWLAEFEEGWDEQRLATRVEQLPPAGQPLRLPALIELVKIDLERNWQHGRRLSLADYTARYPELGPAEALPPDLLLAEDEICRQFGEVPATLAATTDLVAARSPALARRAGPAPAAAGRVPCVPGYEVLGKLGQGGMGAVYKARHLRLNRVVALKVIGDTVNARPADLVRFSQEAEVIAHLQHPNIVQIYEVGEYADGSYLALEYVDGSTLDRQVNGIPQPPREAGRLVEVLARAVQYAHEQKIIHRDLKPANVLLTAAGAPKIADFGLARPVGLGSGLTTTGAVMGTPSYMAPEQADGRLTHLGPHTDTYALGAILYECLTGRPPFQGATILDTLMQVRQQDPVPPHRLLGSNKRACPADLETICLKCLEKDPHRRYASAGALADDLGRFLAGAPIAARPVGSAGRAWRWARRNPGWAAMLAAVAAMLLVIAGGSSVMTLRLNQALQVSEEERWVTLVAQARASSRSRERGQRFDGLAAIRQALKLPVPPGHTLVELRNEAIACLVLPDVEPAGEGWEGQPTGTVHSAFDATFDRYARADRDGNVSVRRVADDAELLSWKGPPAPRWHELAFSPNGRFLLDRRGDRLRLYRLDRREAEVVLEDTVADAATVRTVPFSPDGRFFAMAPKDQGGPVIAVFDLQAAKEAKEVQRLPMALIPYRLAFAPDSRRLAVSSGPVVRVFDLESGKPLSPDLPHPTDTRVEWIAWHPDGRTLATTCGDGDLRIRLWDVATGKLLLPPLVGHHSSAVVAAFSPAGDCLVSNDWTNTLRLWDPRSGRQLLQMQSTAAVFSRDGGLLAPDQSGPRVRMLRAATRRPLRALAAPPASEERRVFEARISSDGRLLLVTRSDALALLDWDQAAELASIPLPETYVGRLDPQEGLLTGGWTGGLLHWPVRVEPATGRLHVGPPESLDGAPVLSMSGCRAGSRVLALPASSRGAVVLHRPDKRRVTLGPREDVRSCAVSPDGRWVATGNHWNVEGIGATVWDLPRETVAKNFFVDGLCQVGFSPDGQWLLTTGGRFRLWKVGTWEEGPPLAQPDDIRYGLVFAFSPDGRTLALAGGFSQVWLVDVETGAEIARLTVPEQTRVTPQCFSPDGSQLVAIGSESNLVYIWDLRALRAELKELGLDWDAPPYPEVVHAAQAPLEVRVVGADDLLGPDRLNEDAWRLVTGPVDQRDPARALQLIHKAVKQKPAEALFLNTLGVAHYRNGQYKEAIGALEKSLAAGKGQLDAFDLYFLAMCHAKLGDAARAKDCYEKAVKWVEAQKNLPAGYVEELKAFRAEAAQAILTAP